MIPLRRLSHRVMCVSVPLLLASGCAGDPAAPAPLAAKGGGGGPAPKVEAADPDSGAQGQRLNVRVLGSGYNASAVASWERNGAPDPKITVYSTTFVSSSELVADIEISADADPVLYDIAVEILLGDGSRKKGVGVEKFQVQMGGGNGPKVNSTDPSVGPLGQRINVHVNGNGFNSTAVTTWERNGTQDPKVTVHSTTFHSTTLLVADISIAADADTGFYDVGVQIVRTDGSLQKGVGVAKFEVRPAADLGKGVPYYVTIWGGILTNPTADDPPLAQEQLMSTYNIQTDSISMQHRFSDATAGWAHTALANTRANSVSCRKANNRMSDATLALMVEELTSLDDTKHGLAVEIDAAAVAGGEGSGRIGTHYLTAPGHPLYPGEIWVDVQYMSKTAPDYGTPKVTLVGSDASGTTYRVHAGYGSARVWWRTQGGGTIACKLMDDVYVRIRPGF